MTEDAASSSSTALSRDRSDSSAWPSVQSFECGPRRSVYRTTEKSVVFRVRTQEKLSSGRENRVTNRSSSKQLLRLTQGESRGGTDDKDVNETLAELYDEMERKKRWLDDEDKTFRRGQQQLKNLQREHAALGRALEQCKHRRKERVRIQKMLRGPQVESGDFASDRSSGSDSDDDSNYSSHKDNHRRSSNGHHHHHQSRRDGAKKERKRLRRFQSEVSLRFQLLQSENRRSDLQVEKVMADLRREYADSCLFGNSLNF